MGKSRSWSSDGCLAFTVIVLSIAVTSTPTTIQPNISTMLKSIIVALLIASASAFAPASTMSQRSTKLYAEEMSKAVPFLVRPEKLDGSMVGDMGFDPMRLSDIQTDLKYARWAEIKHGRICMLAIVGILVQQAGIHLPGDAYTNSDIFGAVSQVGFGVNVQIFLGMAAVEIATFNMHYGEGEPGDYGFDGGQLKNMSADQIATRKTSEIVHCRLAMIAFVGAMAQTLLFGSAIA